MELPQHSPARPNAQPVGLFCMLEYRATGDDPPEFLARDDVQHRGLVVDYRPGHSISVLRLDVSTQDDPVILDLDWSDLAFDDGPGAEYWGRLVGWRFFGTLRELDLVWHADMARRRLISWRTVATFEQWYDVCRGIG